MMHNPLKDLFTREPIKIIHQLNCLMMSQFSLEEQQADLPISDIQQRSFSSILAAKTLKKRIQRRTYSPTGTIQFEFEEDSSGKKPISRTRKQQHEMEYSGKHKPKHLSIPMWSGQESKIYASTLHYQNCEDEVDFMNSNPGKKMSERQNENIETIRKFESSLTGTESFISTDHEFFTTKKNPKQLSEKQVYQESKLRVKKVINKYCQSEIDLDEIVQTSQESNQTTHKSDLQDDSFFYMGGKHIESKKITGPPLKKEQKFLKVSQEMLKTKKGFATMNTIQTQQQEFIKYSGDILKTKNKNYL